IDRHGGRAVLTASNAVLGAGLVLLGMAQGVFGLAIAWTVLGIGMAMGLYDPAFATLTRLYGLGARAPITGITLIAGLASTARWRRICRGYWKGPALRRSRRLPPAPWSAPPRSAPAWSNSACCARSIR